MHTLRAKTLLLIEDDVGLLATLSSVAESLGFEVKGCETAQEAIDLALAFTPTLVFCDVHLPSGDGRKVLAAMRDHESLSDCQVVLMTGDWVGVSRQASVDCTADDYLAKPFTLEEFTACVHERYRQANL